LRWFFWLRDSKPEQPPGLFDRWLAGVQSNKQIENFFDNRIAGTHTFVVDHFRILLIREPWARLGNEPAESLQLGEKRGIAGGKDGARPTQKKAPQAQVFVVVGDVDRRGCAISVSSHWAASSCRVVRATADASNIPVAACYCKADRYKADRYKAIP
jgi:hypothetical protein